MIKKKRGNVKEHLSMKKSTKFQVDILKKRLSLIIRITKGHFSQHSRRFQHYFFNLGSSKRVLGPFSRLLQKSVMKPV